MRYDETPAGALAAAMGRPSPAQPGRGGRSEAEQRALRQQWELAMDAADAGMPGVMPWRRRIEEARAFAAEIAQRGMTISSVAACEEGAHVFSGHEVCECRLADLVLQERLRSLSRIHDAERSGAIRPVRNADIDAHNRERLAQAQARQDRLGGLAGSVA